MKDKPLISYELDQYIDKAQDTSSLPGGGSICALVASLAGSLTLMVYKLSKKDLDQDRVLEAIDLLKTNVDRDAHAFDQVVQAMALPKETEEEKKIRSEKIQAGYRVAIQVPLATVKSSLDILRVLAPLRDQVSIYAKSDMAIAVDMCDLAIKGSIQTINLNLKGLKDGQEVQAFEEEIRDLVEEKEGLLDLIRRDLGQ
ncbi:MAG: cyclodeaminase/cyclohydrolase family protein [Tissierellia bacterium]|nr:cyclodeaminase/cyclohydrolase family protein [Tissierellia bacterium]